MCFSICLCLNRENTTNKSVNLSHPAAILLQHCVIFLYFCVFRQSVYAFSSFSELRATIWTPITIFMSVYMCKCIDSDIFQLQVRQRQARSTRKTPTNHSHLLPSSLQLLTISCHPPKLLWLVSNSPFHWSFQLHCVSAHSAATAPYISPL